jgi:zinc transporter
MLVLSIAAVVFLPLNLLASMFGMNVGGVPFGQSAFGFWVIGVVLSVLGVGGVLLFKRLGWLEWGDGG